MGEPEVRDQIARYLATDISAVALEVSLPDGWDLDQARDPQLRRLVLTVLGYLSEFRNGDLSEDELRMRLRDTYLEGSDVERPKEPGRAPVGQGS
jgi:hypothetical protein